MIKPVSPTALQILMNTLTPQPTTVYENAQQAPTPMSMVVGSGSVSLIVKAITLSRIISPIHVLPLLHVQLILTCTVTGILVLVCWIAASTTSETTQRKLVSPLALLTGNTLAKSPTTPV